MPFRDWLRRVMEIFFEEESPISIGVRFGWTQMRMQGQLEQYGIAS